MSGWVPTVRAVAASQMGVFRVDDTGSVAQVVWGRWQVRPALAQARFAEPGWSYQEQVVRPCPRCGGPLYSLRKPYESAGRTYRYVALVCPACPATFTLADVGAKKYDDVMKPLPAGETRAASGSGTSPGAGLLGEARE